MIDENRQRGILDVRQSIVRARLTDGRTDGRERMYTYYSLTKSFPFVQFYSDFRLNLVRSKVPRISSLANPKLAAAQGKQIPSREERKRTRFHKRKLLFRAAARKQEELIKLRALSLSLSLCAWGSPSGSLTCLARHCRRLALFSTLVRYASIVCFCFLLATALMFVLRNSVNKKYVFFGKFSGLLRLTTFRLWFFFLGYMWTVLKKLVSLGTRLP
jgi:hypothetical protein